jgi:hypothetical protein
MRIIVIVALLMAFSFPIQAQMKAHKPKATWYLRGGQCYPVLTSKSSNHSEFPTNFCGRDTSGINFQSGVAIYVFGNLGFNVDFAFYRFGLIKTPSQLNAFSGYRAESYEGKNIRTSTISTGLSYYWNWNNFFIEPKISFGMGNCFIDEFDLYLYKNDQIAFSNRYHRATCNGTLIAPSINISYILFNRHGFGLGLIGSGEYFRMNTKVPFTYDHYNYENGTITTIDKTVNTSIQGFVWRVGISFRIK